MHLRLLTLKLHFCGIKGRVVCKVRTVVSVEPAVSFSLSEKPAVMASVWKSREKHAYQKEARLLQGTVVLSNEHGDGRRGRLLSAA
jgi:hypothetical protein